MKKSSEVQVASIDQNEGVLKKKIDVNILKKKKKKKIKKNIFFVWKYFTINIVDL